MLLLLLLLHPFIHSFIHLSPVETVALPDALPRPVSIFLCPTLEYLSVLSSSCLFIPTSCCLSSWCFISPSYHFCFVFLLLLRLHPPNSSSFGLIHRYLVLLSSCYFSLSLFLFSFAHSSLFLLHHCVSTVLHRVPSFNRSPFNNFCKDQMLKTKHGLSCCSLFVLWHEIRTPSILT